MRKLFSTSTLIDSTRCVPWLAADGRLAYTPENPPATDYFFQYSWILPEIFDPEVNKRRHYYFGAPIRDYAARLLEFWKQARRGQIQRVYFPSGSLLKINCAHLSPYTGQDSILVTILMFGCSSSMAVINGSVSPPSLTWKMEEGQILLYRGIQGEETFRYPDFAQDLRGAPDRRTWDRYLALQWRMLADSALSFNTIHDQTKRCETACLNDGTWLADELATESGLDIVSEGLGRALWSTGTCSFSLEPQIAENKFGAHFVVAKTPINNIRLTTFFAGEAEVRLVDPSQIHFLKAVGCTVAA